MVEISYETLIPKTLSREQREGLRTLWGETWRATYSGVFNEEALESLISSLDDPELTSMLSGIGVKIIVASLGGMIIGSAVFKEVGTIAYLWGMYVLPSCQRQKIGHGVIISLVKNINSATTINIYVLETSESALKFYEKMGFSEVSREIIQLSPGLIVNSVLKSVALNRLRAILNSAEIV